MAKTSIASSMPQVNFLGTKDASKTTPQGTPEAMAFHRPLLFHFASEGPTEQLYIPSNVVTGYYGQEFLDPKSPYFTHSSPYVQETIDTVSRALHIRVLPEDCPAKSNLAIWVDYVLTDLPVYQRDSLGQYVTDDQGEFIDTGTTVKGPRARFSVEPVALDKDGASMLGRLAAKPGLIGTSENPSVKMPLLDFEAMDYMDASNIGIKLWAPTTQSADPLDMAAVEATGAYLLRFAIWRRDNSMSSASAVATYTYQDASIPVHMGERIINVDQDVVYDLDKNVPEKWMTTDPSLDIQRCLLGGVNIYRENIAQLVSAIIAAETTAGSGLVDENAPAMVNWLGGTTTDGTPYHAYQIDDLLNGGAQFDASTIHYLKGGGTGTMTNDSFNKAVRKILSNLDAPYNFRNYARFPFNAIWDSGFDHQTKMLIPTVMAARYDSWIALATQDIAQPNNTPQEDASYATAILTRLQQFPDSVEYNTPSFRGIIHGQAAEWIGSPSITVRVPQSLDLFHKFCLWGNDPTGKANEAYAPDAGSQDGDPTSDNRVVTRTKNISNVDVTSKTRAAEWASGIVYVEDYDTRSQFYSGIQSFYQDRTSVLRSGLVGMCVANGNRYAWEAWRAFTGTQGITDGQLISRTEKYVSAKFRANISQDRLVATPHASITAKDEANGDSWSLSNDLYVNGMRTVLNANTVVYRMADLGKS